MLGLFVLLPHANAQEESASAAGRPSWLIMPSVSGSMTLTDNARPGQGFKQGESDFITGITPSVRVTGSGGRVSGDLSFSWQQNIYARHSTYNNDQKTLAATGKAEMIERWLFLDATANISQTPQSVFSTQTVGNELANGNRGETRSYQWSPYVQGYFGGSTSYELRYRNSHTTANTGIFAVGSGVDTQAWSGRLAGATPFSLLGWSLSAEDQVAKRDSFPDSKTSRLLGTLEYRLDPQFKFNVSAGRESDNFSSFDLRTRTVSGVGFDWAPTERTALSVKKERHSFGDGHTIDFSHRTAMTAWKFTDIKAAVIPAQQFTTVPLATAYDLLYLQLASSIPDAATRAQVVRQLLQLYGIPLNGMIYGNIMSQQPFIQRRQEASVSLTGANNTVTFTAQRSSSDKIGTSVSTLDDFALSQNIRQSGLSGIWVHYLTPNSNLTLNALTSNSRGDNATLETRLRSLTLLYTTRLGARTTASLGLRQNNFDGSGSTSSDYTEHAITGTLSASF